MTSEKHTVVIFGVTYEYVKCAERSCKSCVSTVQQDIGLCMRLPECSPNGGYWVEKKEN
jgi:hypothetical protein